MTDDTTTKIKRITQINRTFTPAAPVSRRSAFSGRFDQIMQITAAVSQPGRHIVLYGERGVGKTSLANVLSELLVPVGTDDFRVYAVRVTCNVNDNFTSLWTRVLRELRVEVPEDWAYAGPNPDGIRQILAEVSPPMVIVLDEYDRLENDDALSLMADTIKSLSDHLVPSKLVLVGVSDSIDQLIGEHESVKRAIEEVAMPRMTTREIAEVVMGGFGELGMGIESQAVARIAKLAEGLPTYAHSLSLKSGTRAIQDDRNEVVVNDVVEASAALVKDPHSPTAAYHQAIQSPRPENQFAQVLAACALAPKDELGYFTPAAVRDPLSRIMGKPSEIPAFSRHLSEFIRYERGAILQRRGEPRRYRYRFRDPLMQPFAIMAAVSHDLIPHDFLEELFAPDLDTDWEALTRSGNGG
ncbi:AAA family ATPase [Promicromonospora sukumoe]